MARLEDKDGFFNVRVDDSWFQMGEDEPSDGCGIFWEPNKPKNFRRIGRIELPAVVTAANCAIEEAGRLGYKKLRVISVGLSKFIVEWIPLWKANNWYQLGIWFNPYLRPKLIENRDLIEKMDDLLRISRQNNMTIEFQDGMPLYSPC